MAGAMLAMMNNVAGVSYTPLAGSLQFNGSTQYLSMSPGSALGTGAYTIEGWFYNNSTYATQKAFVATDQSGALSLFNTDAQSFTLDKYGGGGARTYTFPNNTLQVNKWQYIILTTIARPSPLLTKFCKCKLIRISNYGSIFLLVRSIPNQVFIPYTKWAIPIWL